jgi:hypothetical protein
MSLYARSDLMSVSIPNASGGCGRTHSRPVTKGVVARVWELNCPPCEAYLRGDNKGKVIKVTGGDKNKGIAPRMEHVADSDPHWASTPASVPQTPDEEKIHSVRAELGAKQLQMLEGFAAAVKAGLDIPPDAMYVLEQNFDPRILKGHVLCSNGHENPAGSKFCADCGVNMKVRAAIEEKPDNDSPLAKLSVAALKQMCKDEGLPTSGTKAKLVERLS